MTAYDIRFNGTFITTSPISVTPPNAEVIHLPGGGKANEVAQLPISIDGKTHMLPVLPASTLRGKLRRSAVQAALVSLKDKPSLQAWLYATLGGVKGSEQEETYDVLERLERRAGNPILGLFGASAPWDPSNAFISYAAPTSIVRPETVTAVRSDDMIRKPDIFDLLDTSAGDAYLAMRQGTKDKNAAAGDLQRTSQALVKAKRAGDQSEIARLTAEEIALKAKAGELKESAGNSMLMPHSHRIMPAGVELSHRMTLRKVSDIEAGLFLKAIDHLFAEEPFVGGRLSLGYGQFNATWNVQVREKGAQWVDAGSISGETFENVAIENPKLQAFVAAWEAFAKSGKLTLETRNPAKRARKSGGQEFLDAAE